MYKKIIALLVCLCTVLMSFTSCSGVNSEKVSAKSDGKIKVVVSFNAMREFTYAIAKDKADIEVMIPDGTEPHDFEPKPSDLKSLSDAKVFVYNGLNMEAWADKAVSASGNKNIIAVNASNGSSPIECKDADEIKEHGKYDPHLWVSLKGAEIESQNIKNALVKADPSNKDFYEKNYTDFTGKLDYLYKEYDAKFKTVKSRSFVTGHAAFAYLCRDFNLTQNSVEDVFADGEPSTKKLGELVDLCRKDNIKTIFVEDMVSPKVSKTLADEVGAKVEKIHTIESSEKGKDYIQCMKENLQMIYDSLK